MKRTGLVLALSLVSLTIAAGERPAKSLDVLQSKIVAGEIVTLKSKPPQFDLILSRQMPSAGWELTVDSVEVDDAGGRIVVKVTEQRPSGMAAQVLTPTKLKIPLGTLSTRRYIFELWLRPDLETAYLPAHTMILTAS